MPLKYRFVVGTGGIGKGILFKLISNENLGRNETRLAELTNFQDYCKLHIILHYVAAFLEGSLPVYALSSIGVDETGEDLVCLMRTGGINTDYIKTINTKKTMYAVCYQFPTGEGGNISSLNAANDFVTEEDMEYFFRLNLPNRKGIVLAAPEVPVEARIKLLKLGKEYDCYNIASILSGEVKEFANADAFKLMNLLAVNEDEVGAIAQYFGVDGKDYGKTVFTCLKNINPSITLIVTLGSRGSVTYCASEVQFTPAVTNQVVNTAGAGDCFLGTIIAAMIKGIPLFADEDKVITTAQGIASIAAAMKISCSDTINFSINKKSLLEFAENRKIKFSKDIIENFFE